MGTVKVGQRVRQLETNKIGTVSTVYHDDGRTIRSRRWYVHAAWIEFDDGSHAVLYPDEFTAI